MDVIFGIMFAEEFIALVKMKLSAENAWHASTFRQEPMRTGTYAYSCSYYLFVSDGY